MSASLASSETNLLQPEPVFVFGTDLAGKHDGDGASFAVQFHQAEKGLGSGASGNAYAIPYQNSRGELLPADVIKNYIETFSHHAAENPQVRFMITRFACDRDGQGHSDEIMARMFAKMPDNCQLPGVWSRLLHDQQAARLLLFDPGAHLKDPKWQKHLQSYLALNVPLWNVPSIEIVSVGSARAIVANDAGARKLGLRHRIIGMNEAYYGRDAALAAEHKAIWYSTHLLNVFDFDQTAQPQQIRVVNHATRAGLVLDQLDVQLV